MQLASTVEAKLRSVGQQCRFDLVRNFLATPSLSSVGLTKQHCRIKSKQIYNGTLRKVRTLSGKIQMTLIESVHHELQCTIICVTLLESVWVCCRAENHSREAQAHMLVLRLTKNSCHLHCLRKIAGASFWPKHQIFCMEC